MKAEVTLNGARTALSLLAAAGFAAAIAGDAVQTPPTWRNPKDGMEFVWVPPGALATRPGNDAERLAITNGFWVGRTEVTVKQFREFVAATRYVTDAERATNRFDWKQPGFAQADNHPVVYLTGEDAQAYARWAGVDLPTDVEWLYAARAGAKTQYHWGDEVEDAYAWHRGNAGDATRPVGSLPPNAWGLHEPFGNVYEYCRLAVSDPQPGESLVLPFGGSWTRCPDRFGYDLPAMPSRRPEHRGEPFDDDRGFRCLRRGSGPRP